MSANPEFSKHARIRARRSAVQAMYQWEMTHSSINDVIKEFITERDELKKADVEYFSELLRGMAGHIAEHGERLTPFLDRPLAELDPVERAILHIGLYELLFRSEIPWRVIVNEAVELAKMFGAEGSYKFINGVLDKLARTIRTTEINAIP